ncbi:MAG: PD-(D/E)XK nuclease family protein [Bacteroidota bacterium]
METFLDKLAKHILEKQIHPEKVTVVFPSRRAGVFFRRSYAKQAAGAAIMPAVFAMEDFVMHYSELQPADAVTLNFELYEIHKQINPKSPDSLTQFLKYSATIIRDFNELDLHLVNPSEAFRFLVQISELKVWNIEEHKQNDFTSRYVRFFRSLEQYYNNFKERLLQKGIAWQGMAFRQLAENTKTLEKKGQFFCFAGFNELTPSEETIIDYLIRNNQAEIIPDADRYYLKDVVMHEAGTGLRRIHKKWPQANMFVSDDLRSQSKTIRILGAPGDVPQAKAAGELLYQFGEEQDVAVVLANEALLEPFLHSVPENIDTFNITMGLPLQNTMLYSLFHALFRMQTANTSQSDNKRTIHYKEVIRVLTHPAVVRLLEHRYPGFRKKKTSPAYLIKNKNIPFYTIEKLEQLHKELDIGNTEALSFLWKSWEQKPEKAIQSLMHLTEEITTAENPEKTDHILMAEYAVKFNKVLNRIHALNQKYKSVNSIDVLWHLFRQLSAQEKINFRGEPLKGIQVMGMLETRILDFENVILLGANEQSLPGNQHDVSFIPFEMRRHYNLPTKSDAASVYAYHFYHLLQRTVNASLLYNNSAEGGLGNNEESRFLKQLRYELPRANPKIKITDDMIQVPVVNLSEQDFSVKKTPDVLNALQKKAEEGFSATALNKFRQCSLKFYFDEVLKIDEQEEVEETIEAKTLGNVIHATLENLFKPHENEDISPNLLKQIAKKKISALEDAFGKELNGKPYKTGKNLLIYQLATHWLTRFFEYEEKTLSENLQGNNPWQFLHAEQKLESSKTFSFQDIGSTNVKFKGILDRIDKVGDTTRIIDYKTGNVNPSDLGFKSIDELKTRSDKKEAFQLLFYQWLFTQQPENVNIDSSSITAAIFSFPKMSHGLMQLNTSTLPEAENDFENWLIELINQIFDPDLPFQKTEDWAPCRYCDFINLCNRNV